MNNLKIEKKQLGRALAVVVTVGSLLGVIASPAMAIDGEVGGPASWDLSVTVQNDEYCFVDDSQNSPPSWQPDPTVTYTVDNLVNAFADSQQDQLVAFSVDLKFEAGNNSGGCSEFGNIAPSGDVYSSFVADTPAPGFPELVMFSLDCDDPTTGCPVSTVISGGGLINGQLNTYDSVIPGTRTGVLTVDWVPSQDNTPN
jgi:hypothetical protein